MDLMAAHNAIVKKIFDYSKTHTLLVDNTTIIVGLSGGPDSVFLLHILIQFIPLYNLTLIAAHLNHEWRKDAYKDEIFCSQLCAQLNIPLIIGHLSDLPLFKKNGSQEELGRKARRYFLEDIAKKHNAISIALGHHQDDQQETFFIRLMRGASLTGLCAMKPKQGNYIRPLLNIYKKEIVAYLHQHAIPYTIDITNQSPDYLRNKIRALLPHLSSIDKRFPNNFSQTLKRLTALEQFLSDITLKELNSSTNNNQLHIQKLLEMNPIMQQRVLMLWMQNQVPCLPASESFLDEILRFLARPGNSIHKIHPTWQLKKHMNFATIIQSK